MNFYLGLRINQEAGKLVRSITLTNRDAEVNQEEMAETQKNSTEVVKALRAQGIKSDNVIIFTSVVEGLYRFLPNIQTLIILHSEFNIPFQSKLANNRLAPLPFLTHSLKKLFIPLWAEGESNLKARNVVWILVFCTGLRSATLGCIFDQKDFKYLAEFSETFSGLSQIQKLALGVDFYVNESTERYWDGGVGKQWIGGNRKSQALFNLLKVTKNLQCIEINSMRTVSKEKTSINFSCLLALKSSYLSLEYFRLFGVEVNQDDPEELKANSNFSLFQKVKVMTLSTAVLVILSRNSQFRFPPGLKFLCIPYYGTPSIREDTEVTRALKVKSFPSLEVITIPSTRIFKTGTQENYADYDLRECWLHGRRELEKAEVVKSGKVKLRIVEPGELSE